MNNTARRIHQALAAMIGPREGIENDARHICGDISATNEHIASVAGLPDKADCLSIYLRTLMDDGHICVAENGRKRVITLIDGPSKVNLTILHAAGNLDRPEYIPKTRNCLVCRKSFLSRCFGERVCAPCKLQDQWRIGL